MVGNYPAGADKDGSTLKGGAANDSIFAGAGDSINAGAGNNKIELTPEAQRDEDAQGATITADAAKANTDISGFKFGNDDTADNLKTGDAAIATVATDEDGNVSLVLDNGSKVNVADAADEVVKFENQYTTNGPINAKFGDDELEVNDDADFYWAAGEDATVKIAEDFSGNANFDLNNADFNNHDVPSFYGDIKDVDASALEGPATLKGNDEGNVLTASKGGSLLDGGAKDDTLVGGEGVDTFVAGDGNDVIKKVDNGDLVTTGDAAIADVTADENGNVTLTLDNGNTVTLEDAADKKVQFANQYTKDAAGVAPINAQFGDDELEVTDDANFYWAAGDDATISVSEDYTGNANFDLNNADFNNREVPSFYGDSITAFDASAFEGPVTIAANDNGNKLTASKGGSLLKGGAGKDTLIGGDGEDTFVAGNGNDVIRNFNADDDKLIVAGAIDTVAVDENNNVVLTIGENKVTVEGAAGQSFGFDNEYTNDPGINMQVSATELSVDGNGLYWAQGDNATVSLGDYEGEKAVVNLSDANFNNGALSFYGNIKDIDATDYTGDAELYGNESSNAITGGEGNNTLWGGNGGDDTLIGGEGDNTFIYQNGNGNDVIRGVHEGDTVKLDGVSLDDLNEIDKALFVGDDVKFNLKDGGSLTVKDGKVTEGVTYEVGGTQYVINDGEWEYKN